MQHVKTSIKRTYLTQVCLALLLMLAASQAKAQTIITSYTNTFDDAASVTSWHHWYDIHAPTFNGPLMDWDSTQNNTVGHPGSGSVLYSNTWPGHVAGGGQGQDVFYGTFGNGGIFDTSQSLDATKYDSVSFDFKGWGGSPTNLDGNICRLQVGTFHNYSVFVITNIDIPFSTTNGWTHYVATINKATIPTNLCQGITFNISCYGGRNANLIEGTNTTMFWLDNIQMTRSKEKLPAPRLLSSITSPNPGLNLFSSTDSSDQYQRTNIKLLNNIGVGWLGQTNITYSMTIKDFPSGATYPGYQAHIFISTGPANNSGFDYGDPNVIMLDIKQNANGTGNALFRYKTNQPNGNSMIYGAGTLGGVNSSNILGKWSLTFNQDTNITVTSPEGNTFTTNITAEAAALFAEPIYVAFGAQPNNPTNIPNAVVLSRATITNEGTATAAVDDNFLADTVLDTGIWQPLSAAPNTVILYPNDPGQRLVKWTLPDTGYGLQVTTNVTNPNSWTTLTGNEATGTPLITTSAAGVRTALVPSSALGPNQNYFRLFTRNFTKLQILLPGETAAPGTPTGKTGTPDPQSVGIPFDVVVNAVNPNWFLALTADDTVHLTSTDGTATLPADGNLAGGSVTLSVTLNTAGNATITVSDVTDNTKTANTSASVTVNP